MCKAESSLGSSLELTKSKPQMLKHVSVPSDVPEGLGEGDVSSPLSRCHRLPSRFPWKPPAPSVTAPGQHRCANGSPRAEQSHQQPPFFWEARLDTARGESSPRSPGHPLPLKHGEQSPGAAAALCWRLGRGGGGNGHRGHDGQD